MKIKGSGLFYLTSGGKPLRERPDTEMIQRAAGLAVLKQVIEGHKLTQKLAKGQKVKMKRVTRSQVDSEFTPFGLRQPDGDTFYCLCTGQKAIEMIPAFRKDPHMAILYLQENGEPLEVPDQTN